MGDTPAIPPPTASEISFAALWYYEDNIQQAQGPFSAADMRNWFTAGFFPSTTSVAPTFYGEVPTDFWPIAQVMQ